MEKEAVLCNCSAVENAQSSQEVVVGFEGAEPGGLAELLADHAGEITVVRAKGFEAFEFGTELLVVLGPTVVIQLASIIKTHLKTSRRVRIKVDGVEIEGVTADKALEVLKEIQAGRTPEV
jgi:hypothetical protein